MILITAHYRSSTKSEEGLALIGKFCYFSNDLVPGIRARQFLFEGIMYTLYRVIFSTFLFSTNLLPYGFALSWICPNIKYICIYSAATVINETFNFDFVSWKKWVLKKGRKSFFSGITSVFDHSFHDYGINAYFFWPLSFWLCCIVLFTVITGTFVVYCFDWLIVVCCPFQPHSLLIE